MNNGRVGRTSDYHSRPRGDRPIVRFARERVCVNCDTVLSIYNSTEFCSVHEPPHRSPLKRVV